MAGQSWTQKHGSFVLALVMALCTGLFWLFSSNQKGDEAKRTADEAKATTTRIEKEGSAFAQATRQMVLYQGEKIAKIESNQDRALDLLTTQREVNARMAEQISYLVQICGQQKHAENESSPQKRTAVTVSR